jgi:NADPH:quinone reductase-like Zn-dependent oxidoreductase
MGNGGFEQLVYCDVPMPELGAGEVLVKVLAAGVNNTEINTRIGWYSGGGWHIPTPFPFIQGTDCCGVVTQVAHTSDAHLLEQRVLIRSCMRPHGFDNMINIWMGSDFNGAFAQYVKVPAHEVFPINSSWTDAATALQRTWCNVLACKQVITYLLQGHLVAWVLLLCNLQKFAGLVLLQFQVQQRLITFVHLAPTMLLTASAT